MLNLINCFNNFLNYIPLDLYFQYNATFQMEGLVEFHDNIYASTTTMPPSIAPPSLSPGIGGIII